MKKAFTLSETLITLAIISVLAAILIPALNNVKPDKDRVSYQKALYTLQSAMSSAMDSIEYEYAANVNAYWKDPSVNTSGKFCEKMADAVNTSGRVNCASTSSYTEPNFMTSDGIRYWGLEGTFADNEKLIKVDRTISATEMKNIARVRGASSAEAARGLKVKVRYDGKVYVPDDAPYEMDLVERSLEVSRRPKEEALSN